MIDRQGLGAFGDDEAIRNVQPQMASSDINSIGVVETLAGKYY